MTSRATARVAPVLLHYFCVQVQRRPSQTPALSNLQSVSVSFRFCQDASLLASILPMAATIRQTTVKPPIMYHHWLFEIYDGIQEKNSVPTMAVAHETTPRITASHITGIGKMRCNLKDWGSRW